MNSITINASLKGLITAALIVSGFFVANLALAATTTASVFIDTNVDGILNEGELFFNTIQEAINTASDNDTVHVIAGSYTEQVTINKSLDLIGEGETITTILAPAVRISTVAQGTDVHDYILAAYALSGTIDVRVEGFTIDAGSQNKTAGTARIDGVFFRDVNDAGGTMAGLFSSTIHNFASTPDYESWGLTVYGDSLLTIDDNDISDYTRDGLLVIGGNITISGNTITGSATPLNGINIQDVTAGTVTGNTVTGNTRNLPWAAGGIVVWTSSGMTISDNHVNGNFYGIDLEDGSHDITVSGNELTDNIKRGISLNDSDNNTVSGNTITGPASGTDDVAIGLANTSTGNTIGGPTLADGNTITMATAGAANLYAIYMQTDVATGSNTIQYNTINGGQRAVQFDGPPGITGTTTVANNTISGQAFGGILAYNNGDFIISDNTLTNTVRPLEFFGPINLTIIGNTINGSTYAGINLGSFSGMANVSSNTIHDIATDQNGIWAQTSGAGLGISLNTIYSITGSGGGGGRGIQIDASADNVNIDGNEIYNVTGFAGIVIDTGATGTKINNNYTHDNEQGMVVNEQTAEFNSNRILNNRWGIDLNKTEAIFILLNNKISGNNTNPADSYGLSVWAGTAIAEKNWWGASSGPTHATNGGGSGDIVSDNVTFQPWFTDEAMTQSRSYNVTIGTTGYVSIQAAINNATSGDTINVMAGIYNIASTIVLDKTLIISGPTNEVAKLQGTDSSIISIFEIIASNVTIQNLEITHNALPAFVSAGWAELPNSLIRIPASLGLSGITITNNKIYVPAQSGVMSTWNGVAITVGSGTTAGISITGNTIHNTRNGVVVQYGNTAAISNNTIYDTKGGVMNYTSSQADADNRTISNNSWRTTHNEWDIVWNSASYVPDYQLSVLALSGANNNAYVVDRRDTNLDAMALGNRSHIFISPTGVTSAHEAKGNFNEPFATLTLGINAVVAGGTVNVAAGTYAGFTVNKEVSLFGANRDVDPAGSTDRDGESVINGEVRIEADGTTFNGFKLSGQRIYVNKVANATANYNIVAGSAYHGIYIDTDSPNAQILYNTVSNPEWQGISNQGNSGVIISYNYVTGVTDQHPIESTNHTGTGIEITHNVIIGNAGTKGINYWGGSDVIISNNEISNVAYEAIFTDAKATIRENIIDGCMDGISLYPGSDESVITDNQISNCNYAGISVKQDVAKVTITDNIISDNGATGIELYQISVSSVEEKSVVSKNTITGTKYQGITVFGRAYTEISYNTLTGCNYYGADGTGDWDYAGIHIQDEGGISAVFSTIAGNIISDGINGIQTWSDNVTITGNKIYGMGNTYANEKVYSGRIYKNSAILVGSNFGSGDFDPTGVVIENNEIHDNYWGLFYSADLANGLTAEKNWWGSANPVFSTMVSENVNYDPWYTNNGMTTLSNNTVTNATYTSPTDGQADLPTGATEVTLSNATVMDLSNSIVAQTSEDIIIGGNTVTLTRSVILQSGVNTEPVVLTNSDLSGVSASIPDGTEIQGPEGWNGTIMPPTSGTPSGGDAPAGFSVGDTIISIGSPDGTLVFDNPVTILLAGVTGAVGYRPSGSDTWIRITNICADPYLTPGNPPINGECAISNGVDTKILTYHFTTFGSLTANPTPAPAPGTGGGGDAPPSMSWITTVTGDTTAIITWQTNELSLSWLVYGTTAAYGKEVKTTTYLTGHSVVLNDLSPATTYHYQIKAQDANGYSSSYVDQTFTTLALGEKITGDINKDNKVDIFDFNFLMVNWGQSPTDATADLDGNGQIDIFDFNLLMVNWTD